MRAKLFISVVLGFGLIGGISAYKLSDRATFDSARWKAASTSNTPGMRREMLTPLVTRVLKVGMSMQDTEDLLGCYDEENRIGYSSVFSPNRSRIYIIPAVLPSQMPARLVLEFSADGILIDFYTYEETKPILF